MASDSSWIKICNKVLNEVGHSEIIQIQGYVYTYANFQNSILESLLVYPKKKIEFNVSY